MNLNISSKISLAVLLSIAQPAYAYEPAGTPADWDSPVKVPPANWKLLVDRFEAGFSDDDSNAWEAQFWYGGDLNRLTMSTEGEGERGETPESAELEIAYSRLFRPYWDWQVGIRHDFQPSPEQTHFMVGLQGVVPYEFETQAMLYASEDGDVSARVEFEYDLNLTQRLILQSRMEVNAAFSDVEELGIGSGLNSSELGVRLRYEFRREFAPYIGVEWEKLYGETKDFANSEGEDDSVVSLVAGIRFWF